VTEPTSRDWMEIREWLVRIDTKMDGFNDVKHTADRADQKADRALHKSEDNANAIAGIKKTAMWAIGLTITAFLTLTGIIVGVLF
jgi:hypothetical protein